MNKQQVVIVSVVAIFALIVFNLVYMIYGSDTNVTGNVVKTVDNKDILLSELQTSNDQLRNENRELTEKAADFENKLKEIEEKEKVTDEMCTAKCGTDEICALITKADESLKWTCIRDPSKVLGVGS